MDFNFTNSNADPYGYAGPQNALDSSLNAGGMLGNLGNMLSENPEKLSIMLDALGKNLDPNNPFANIGTSIGQSSLANKALQEEKEQKQDWQKMIADIVSGKTPMTPAGQSGVTSINQTAGKDGLGSETTLNITNPSSITPPPTPGVGPNPLHQQNQPITPVTPPAVPQQTNLGGIISSPF